MSWEGYRQVAVPRFGSLVTAYDRDRVPPGIAVDARNVRYTYNGVATRFGIQETINTGQGSSVTSLANLIRSSAAVPYIPLMFHANGSLKAEAPVGSGQTADILPSSAMTALPANSYMECSACNQRIYSVYSDLKTGTGDPSVYDGTNLDPWSMRPIGEMWAAGRQYKVGEIISPSVINGYIYRCTVSGISGNVEPAWPTTDRATVADNGVTWQEANFFAGQSLPAPPAPGLTRNPGAGAWVASKDVYFRITLLNGNGEGVYSLFTKFTNTSTNDQFVITSPTIPSWLQPLGGAFAVTQYKVYCSQVNTGAVEGTYALQGVATNIGTNVTVNSFNAGGTAPPVTSTAYITNAGNVGNGTRYCIILFVNRNGYISGCTNAVVKGVTLTAVGYQVYVGGLPLGPANTAQRIIAFGPASGADGGPFTFIPNNDVSQGITQTKFVINDNTTTNVTLNFTDAYLQNATDVTDNLRKIKLPQQAHCVYIPALRRILTFGEQPTLIRASEPDDPETFYGDTGYCYCSRDDGEKAVTAREYRGEVYVFKERSAYTISATDQDPARWNFIPRWHKIGPSGPRAVDVGPEFMAFAHRSGGYIYSGTEPTWITGEIQDLWDGINWAYGHLIKTFIDNERKEVRFCVPFGGSTVPNVTFVCNYLRGIEAPIHWSAFAGREITSVECRKWSVDDIAANDIMRWERPLSAQNANDVSNNVLLQTQIAIATPSGDGSVSIILPDSYDDNGAGINSIYEVGSQGFGDTISRFGGLNLLAVGNGDLLLWVTQYADDPIPLKPFKLSTKSNTFYRRQGRGRCRQHGVRFSNNKVAGAWFELLLCNLYLCPLWPAEKAQINGS